MQIDCTHTQYICSMKKQRTKFLYFSKISGVGKLNCYDCKTVSYLHAYTHGRQGIIGLKDGTTAGGHDVSNYGYQCQTCGKLTTISKVHKGIDEMHAETDKKITEDQYYCKCGGELKQTEPIFCPVCMSFNVNFETQYIT